MNDTPEKGRGTTGFGRPTDRTRRNRLPGGKGSVSHPSHANPKCVSVFPISHVTPCKRPVSREYGFLYVDHSGAGGILRGRGRGQHPNGATECRMGESPARPKAAPGTQAAQRPSSFRRGSDRRRVPGIECALRSCAEPAIVIVAHPYRPEPWTALCAFHADRARNIRWVTA